MFFSFSTLTSSSLISFLFCCSAFFSSLPHSTIHLSFSCTESVFYLTSIVTYFLPLFHCTFWPWSGWATLIRLKSRQGTAAYGCQINDPAFGTFPPVSLSLNSPFYFLISTIFPFSVIINCFVLIMLLSYFLLLLPLFTQWRGWLSHCATSQRVAGSIPGGVTGIFRLHNPSGSTLTLGVDSAFNRNEYQEYFLGGKDSGCVGCILTTYMCRLSWNLGASTSWNLRVLFRPVQGLLYPLLLLFAPTWFFLILFYRKTGDRGSTVVKVLCYKSVGRCFDPS